MKLIPLTKGYFAKVDDEDFERLSQWKWMALTCSHGTDAVYARRSTTLNGRRVTILMHREILGNPKSKVDHEDGDGLNNRKNNLRLATSAQNGANRKIQKHSTPYKGVCFIKSKGVYQAAISINKKQKIVGLYTTAEQAAAIYDNLARIHYGEFAKTNHQMGVL